MTMSVAWSPRVMALRLDAFFPSSVLGPVDVWAFSRLAISCFSVVDIGIGPSACARDKPFIYWGGEVFWGEVVGKMQT